MEGASPPWRKLVVVALVAAFSVVGVTAAQLTSYVIGPAAAYSRGDVAAFDIRAPYRLSYISEVETNRQRDLAEASVAPVFTPPDAQIARQQIALALSLLDRVRAIRAEPDLSEDQRVSQLLAISELSLSEETARRILRLNDVQWSRIAGQVIAVLDVTLRASIRPEDLDRLRAGLGQHISLSLSSEEADIVNRIAGALLVPNTNYDAAATEAARRAARESVKPVERTFEANQIIVRSGQVIGQADLEALEKFNLRRPTLTWVQVVSALLLSLGAVISIGLGMAAARPSLLQRPSRHTALSALVFVVALAAVRLLLPMQGVLIYLLPLAAVALVITSWSGVLPGVIGAVALGGLISIAADRPMEMAACLAAGGMIASLTLGRAEKIGDLLRAGVFAGVAQAAVVLAFGLPAAQSSDLTPTLSAALASLLSGVLASGLAMAMLYITGALFDITTVVQLSELSRLSHPLLREMVTRAPGTYHHSLMVANLAEQAAERIGADALLTRVGAYFHDIGKLLNPQFFIENQIEGINPHDQLDPLTSSAILRAHVTDGLKLAAEHRLPRRIKDFIAEHHGTTVTSYQYTRALQESGAAAPQDFRYPGPRPRSKETALVMLADSSEAAIRAARCTSIEHMEQVLNRVFNERLADRQLDDSELTLRDLEVVRHSFLETLRGMYHPRVQYPVLPNQNAGESPLLSEPTEEWATP
ncbi:MAG: HDIG domain-containing protein [Anaerolineae bacterium]|nr:HDIG domain-containing protein [Anaerolineae bacterium]